MRITHVITRGDTGGAQTHVAELASSQAASGEHVEVVVGTEGQAADRLRAAGIDVTCVPVLGRSRQVVFQRRLLAEVTRAIAGTHPTIVHAHSSAAGLLGRVVARRLGVRSVYTAHGWPFQSGAPLRQRVVSWSGEFAGGHLGDAVICLTETERQRALRARVTSASRIWVVPNGIADVPQSGRARLDVDRAVRLIMVARFASPKRQLGLITVLGQLLPLPWEMVFVGDGPLLSQAKVLAQRVAPERCVFLGLRKDVVDLLAGCDVHVLWSGYEGMPISTLEAMRAGLCNVASDLPGVREQFGDPSAGLLAGDPAALADALRSVIVDPELRRRLGASGRERYEQTYTSSAMAAATHSVYEAVLARPTAGSARPR